MHYVYVLQNESFQFYIGFTSDLKRRFREHKEGKSRSTAGHSWVLVYYEAYLSKASAMERERYLKNNGHAKRAVMQRVRAMLDDIARKE